MERLYIRCDSGASFVADVLFSHWPLPQREDEKQRINDADGVVVWSVFVP